MKLFGGKVSYRPRSRKIGGRNAHVAQNFGENGMPTSQTFKLWRFSYNTSTRRISFDGPGRLKWKSARRPR